MMGTISQSELCYVCDKVHIEIHREVVQCGVPRSTQRGVQRDTWRGVLRGVWRGIQKCVWGVGALMRGECMATHRSA